MGIRRNQKGFGVIEIIIVIAAVIIIAGAGCLVYRNHHEKSKPSKVTSSTSQSKSSTSSSPKKSSSSSTSQPTVSYFTIKEWGVRALDNGSSDLSYSINTSDANWAWLNSQQLADDTSSCAITSNSGNTGYIGRYLPTDDIPTDPSNGETAQQYLSQDFAATNTAKPYYSKVGAYYYIYWSGQSSCGASTTLTNQVTSEIGNIVDNLESIPN